MTDVIIIIIVIICMASPAESHFQIRLKLNFVSAVTPAVVPLSLAPPKINMFFPARRVPAVKTMFSVKARIRNATHGDRVHIILLYFFRRQTILFCLFYVGLCVCVCDIFSVFKFTRPENKFISRKRTCFILRE